MTMFISLKGASQQLIQGTLKLGPNPDEVQVWIKPNFANSTRYLYQIGIPVAWPSSAIIQPNITTANITLSNQFKSVFGTNYSLTVYPTAPNTCNDEFYTNIILIRDGALASNPQTWSSGTEYLVCTIKFTPAGSPGVPVRLVDYTNGGSDGQANFYTVDGNATYYVSSISANNFYSTPGNSTAGLGLCNGGGSQTNVAIPIPCVAPSVNVTNINTTSASIDWSAISGSAGYEYFISTTNTQPPSGTATTGTSFPSSGLTPNTQYYVFVRNNCGGGSFSPWASTNFTTSAAPCNSPTGPTIGTVGVTTADISWGTVSGAVGYEYFLSTTPGTPVGNGTATTSTSYNPSNLTGSTQYYIYVRTNCGGGNFSPWVNNTFTTLVPSCVPPTTPVVGSITTTTAGINWNAISGSSGYEYVLSPIFNQPTGTGTPIPGTSYSASGLTPGTTYYFFVRNNCGGGLYSTWAMVSFNTSCLAPAVSVPSATITSSSAIITWTSTGASTYQYDISTNIDPTSATPSTGGTTTTATTYPASGLAAGITYFAHIRAVCPSGDFAQWITVPFTTVCTQPAAATITGISPATPTAANISWPGIPDVGGYQYWVSTSNNPPTLGTSTISTGITPPNLAQGTQYYVHVRTECSPGIFSQWTTTPFVTVFPPCNPAGPLIINVNGGTANFSWPPIPGVLGYEYAVTTSPTIPTAWTPVTGTSGQVNNLNSNTQYYVHLRSKCGVSRYSISINKSFTTSCFKPSLFIKGNDDIAGTADLGWFSIKGALKYEYAVLQTAIPPSGTSNFLIDTLLLVNKLMPGTKYYLHVRTHCSPTNISEWSTLPFYTSGIAISPNPFTNTIRISIFGNDSNINELELFDATGKLLRKIKMVGSMFDINMSEFTSGIYFLTYRSNNKRYRTQILKIEGL
jgi:hypothetical protein